MDIDDKELFESAIADEAPEIEAPAEAPAAEDQGQPRDDQGRFAPKAQAEPGSTDNPVGHEQQGTKAERPEVPEAHVPSWRLREVREEAERRVAQATAEADARWQRQFAEWQGQNQPKQEAPPPEDVFTNPDGFVDHRVRQGVDPIKSEIQRMREDFSRERAIDKFGPEKVSAAYNWALQGKERGDPEALSAINRAGLSTHPFGELIAAHERAAVFQQIGPDPQAWAQKWLAEQLSDPQKAGAIMQQIQQSARQPNNPQVQSRINLPPSLRNVPSAQSADDDDGDMSDAALFRSAMR